MGQLVCSGLFWFDPWGGQVQSQEYPELFSFIKNKSMSFQSVSQTEPFHNLFHLPLLEEAFDQMETLQQLCLISPCQTLRTAGNIFGETVSFPPRMPTYI